MNESEGSGLKLVRAQPPTNLVDYLRTITIPVAIGNESGAAVIAHSGTLRLQPDFPGVPEEVVSIRFPCNGRRIPVRGFEHFQVEVTPSLLFLPGTNVF